MEVSQSFDTELFIIEVEKRPAIWDITSEGYSNKIIKKKCWEELVIFFGGEELSNAEKNTLGLNLQKKWKNIRDSYSREQRRVKNIKSGSSPERKSPYVYSTQLSFLRKCSSKISTTGSKTQETAETIVGQATEGVEGPYGVGKELGSRNKRSKKRKREDDDADLAAVLKTSVQNRDKRERQFETDDDRQFLLSLLPLMKKVPDYQKLNIRMDIMGVIRSSISFDTRSNRPQSQNSTTTSAPFPPPVQRTVPHQSHYDQDRFYGRIFEVDQESIEDSDNRSNTGRSGGSGDSNSDLLQLH